MKKGFVKGFFIGVLAIGFFWLLSFAFAGSHDPPNPGHPSSQICDSLFCVNQASGLPLVGIGTMFPSSTLYVNASGNGVQFIIESIFPGESVASFFKITRGTNDDFKISSGNKLKINNDLEVIGNIMAHGTIKGDFRLITVAASDSTPDSSNILRAYATCPSGYQRVSCSGYFDHWCSGSSGCDYLGIYPYGNTGCAAVAYYGLSGSTTLSAYAYCMEED
jgi:hypothetical protein